MNNKRIILVGPAASGKDFIKNKFREKGFAVDVSYTTRKPREEEKYGVDYNFISESEFTLRISQSAFYETIKHGEYLYGTGKYEWNNSAIFIMEADGVNSIKEEDRKNCLVIFVTAPIHIRWKRLHERKWTPEQIEERIRIDSEKFKDFKNYDLIINSIEDLSLFFKYKMK